MRRFLYALAAAVVAALIFALVAAAATTTTRMYCLRGQTAVAYYNTNSPGTYIVTGKAWCPASSCPPSGKFYSSNIKTVVFTQRLGGVIYVPFSVSRVLVAWSISVNGPVYANEVYQYCISQNIVDGDEDPGVVPDSTDGYDIVTTDDPLLLDLEAYGG